MSLACNISSQNILLWGGWGVSMVRLEHQEWSYRLAIWEEALEEIFLAIEAIRKGSTKLRKLLTNPSVKHSKTSSIWTMQMCINVYRGQLQVFRKRVAKPIQRDLKVVDLLHEPFWSHWVC